VPLREPVDEWLICLDAVQAVQPHDWRAAARAVDDLAPPAR
jgi:hypothetical protein